MDRESDPSYLEWVRLKDSSTTSAGRDVVELASSLIESLFEKLNEAEALREASCREFDQKIHVLEQTSVKHQQATQNALYELNQAQTQCQSLQENLNVSRNQVASLTKNKSELEDRLAAASRAQEMTEARLRDQLPLQERRASQWASQSEQLRVAKEDLQNMTQEKLRLESQVSNLQSSSVTLKYELSLSQTETENLRRQLEQVHADSREKSSAWREEKATLTRETHDLERKLVNAADDLASAQAQATYSSRLLEDRDKLVKKLQAQIDSLQVGQRAFSESAKNSQFAQLAELYKTKFEESDAQCERLRTDLQTKIEELRIKTEETRILKTNNENRENEVKALQIQVANLTEGIPDNLILSQDKLLGLIRQFISEAHDSSSMDINASTTSSHAQPHLSESEIAKLLEVAASSHNLHQLIGLQQKYEIATAQLVKQRAENRQLEEYFVRIEREMARTEPLMAENRRKYETTLAELEGVKVQLSDATHLLQQKDSELNLNQRKIASLQQQVKQTSSQIQSMLYQSQSGLGNAAASMADIASLHNRNVELEILLRDAQSSIEVLENDRDELKTQNERLSSSYSQMETTISSLEAAISAQEAIHQMSSKRRKSSTSQIDLTMDDDGATEEENDTISMAAQLSQEDGASANESVGSNPKIRSIEDSPKYQHAILRIDELQKMVNELNGERDTWRDSSTKLSISLASKESELERANARIELLQSTHSIHEEQIADFRSKVQRQSTLLEKYEAEVSELSSSRSNAVSQANAATQMLEVSKLQIQLLKDQLDQHTMALAQAREQWQTQQAHFRESSALHAKQEAHWIDLGTQQDARIAQLQKLLEESNQDADDKLHSLQESLSHIRAEHASATAKIVHLEEIIVLKDQAFAQQKEVLEEQRSSLETLKRRPPAPVASVDPVVVPTPRPISEEVEQLTRQLEAKDEALNVANENLASAKQLLAQTEAHMTTLQAQYNSLKEETQTTLTEYEDEIAKLNESLKQHSESETTVREKLDVLVVEHAELKSTHAQLKIDYNARDEEMESLRTQNVQLKSDAQALEETLSSTRVNYQHQVTELSNALTQLDVLQKRVQKISSERDALVSKLENAQQSQLTLKSQLEIKESAHSSEINLLQQRIQDGVANITAMTTEVAMLKSQVNYWKSLSGGASASSGPAEGELASSIQLGIHAESADMDISNSTDNRTLQWVKREYEIKLAELTIAQQESSELRAQVQVLRDSVDRLSSENKSLRDGGDEPSREMGSPGPRGSGISIQHQQAYEKLQAQTEQLNLLRESNVILRQQRDGAEKEKSELISQVAQLQQTRDTLQSLVTRLTHEKDSANQSVQVLTQQNEHWMGRVKELLTKYKDIEAHATQESKIDELSQQVNRLKEENADLQARLETIYEEKQKAYDLHASLVDQKHELELSFNQAKETINAVNADLDAANDKLNTLKEENDTLRSECDEYKEQLEEYVGESTALNEKIEEYEKESNELKEVLNTTKQQLAAARRSAAVVSAVTPASDPVPAASTIAKVVAAAAPSANPPVANVAPPANTPTPALPTPSSTPVTPAPPKTSATKLPPPPPAPKANATAPKTSTAVPPVVPAVPPAAVPKEPIASPPAAAPVSVAVPEKATPKLPPPPKSKFPAPPRTASPAAAAPSSSAMDVTEAPVAKTTAPVAAPEVPKPASSDLPAMRGHLRQLESRLGQLETAKKSQLDAQAQAKATQATVPAKATASPSTPVLQTQEPSQTMAEPAAPAPANVVPPSATTVPSTAAPKSTLPPPPPIRKVPPPPPKSSKRNFTTMNVDAPSYNPSTAPSNSSQTNDIPTPVASSVAAPSPPASVNVAAMEVAPAPKEPELHTEAPAAKRPRLVDEPSDDTLHTTSLPEPTEAQPVVASTSMDTSDAVPTETTTPTVETPVEAPVEVPVVQEAPESAVVTSPPAEETHDEPEHHEEEKDQSVGESELDHSDEPSETELPPYVDSETNSVQHEGEGAEEEHAEEDAHVNEEEGEDHAMAVDEGDHDHGDADEELEAAEGEEEHGEGEMDEHEHTQDEPSSHAEEDTEHHEEDFGEGDQEQHMDADPEQTEMDPSIQDTTEQSQGEEFWPST